MGEAITLLPLVCIKCSTPIPAEADERAWVCAQCKQGMALDEEKGLVSVEVQYAAGIPAEKTGQPFWVFEADVKIERVTYQGNQSADAQQFWAQPRRFFIPAFDCTMDILLNTGIQFLRTPPELQSGPAVPFTKVTLARADLKEIAELIVLAFEAERKDKLKTIQVTVSLYPPALWIMP